MANRQYVGARYVPKFADPVEWNGALSYEALTIVTHLGNSFTSKKPVPANVDIGNTEYWVNTGNYNEQVQVVNTKADELATNINTVNNKIGYQNAFDGKKMLIIGDSNSDVGPDWLGSPRWPESVQALCPTLTVTNNSKSGRRLCKPDGEVTSVVTEVTNLPASIDYDYIVIFAGVNDYLGGAMLGFVRENTDTTTFNGAINYIFRTLKAKCEKAKLFFVSPLTTYLHADPVVKYPLDTYRVASYGCIKQLGSDNTAISVGYINGNMAPGYFINGTSQTYYSMDGLHYKTNYSDILAEYILRKIAIGGDAFVSCSRVATKIPNSDGDYVTENYSYYEVNPDGSIDVKIAMKLARTGEYSPITQPLGEIFANYTQNGALMVYPDNKADIVSLDKGAVIYGITTDVNKYIKGTAHINSKCLSGYDDRAY